MSRFRSLTTRLVVTTVALVALASVLIGTATALVMRSNLTDRLDRDVRATVERTYGGAGPGRPNDEQPMVDALNQAPGTLIAIVGGPNAGAGLVGEERGEIDPLSQEAVDVLEQVPVDRGLHRVQLPGAGSYRVGTVDLGEDLTLVGGLPTDDVDDTVMSLVWVEVLVGLLAVVAAGGVGAIVVRRQLRPLREVADTAHRIAELPLSEGEIDLSDRVPAHLTDERTEVEEESAPMTSLVEDMLLLARLDGGRPLDRDRPGRRVRRARRRTGLPAGLRGPRVRAVRPRRPGPRAQRRPGWRGRARAVARRGDRALPRRHGHAGQRAEWHHHRGAATLTAYPDCLTIFTRTEEATP